MERAKEKRGRDEVKGSGRWGGGEDKKREKKKNIA